MIRTAYRFTFEPDVDPGDVEQALMLATIAVESIHGEPAMAVDGRLSICKRTRTCLIDAETELGADLSRVFAGFMKLYSGQCFRVEHVEYRGALGDILDLFGPLLR